MRACVQRTYALLLFAAVFVVYGLSAKDPNLTSEGFSLAVPNSGPLFWLLLPMLSTLAFAGSEPCCLCMVRRPTNVAHQAVLPL